MNVESHADLMKLRYEWIYKKFGTQELSSYIEEFSKCENELFVLKDFSSFLSMCLNNKLIEIILLSITTCIVNVLSKDTRNLFEGLSLNIGFIFQIIYIFIMCYTLYALLKLIQLILAVLIDSFVNFYKVSDISKQRLLDALQDANKYKVY